MRGLPSILSLFCNKFNTVKPVLRGHSKINKTKVLKTNGILMKFKSIAECSLGAFCNTFDLHFMIIVLVNQFLFFFSSGRFTVNSIIQEHE